MYSPFNKTFSKLKKFTNSINKNITLDEDIVNNFFANIEDFPFNIIESSSVAFLLSTMFLKSINYFEIEQDLIFFAIFIKIKLMCLELSKQFNLSRNTHHHMNKLINSALINCTTDGKRVHHFLDNYFFQRLISN